MGGFSGYHNPELKPFDPGPSALELLSAMQRQKLMPGELEAQQNANTAAQQENQMRAIQMQDQKAMTDAMHEWDGKDINSLPGLMLKHGASAQTVMSTKTGIIKQQQDLANLTKDQLANEKTKNDYFAQQIENVKGLPPEQQPAAFEAAKADAVSKGHLDPQAAQGMQYQGPQQLDLMEKSLLGHSGALETALKGADTREKNAQARKLELETDPNNPANKEQAEQKYRGILNTIQSKGVSGLAQGDLDWAKSYEASQAKTTTQSDSLGVTSTNTAKPSGLASVGARRMASGQSAAPSGAAPSQGAPNLKNALVDEIGQYKLNPTMLSRMTIKHPEIIPQVSQKYPDWSQSNYNAANKAITDLAPSGKTGQQITSYNTFLRHAGALYDAVNTLNNSTSSDLVNKPLNWLAQHTGDPRVADFMAAMQPPMKEFQSFLLNNHAMHEQDVKDAHDLVSLNKTPQEMKAVLMRMAETGSARLSEQNESFKRVTGRDIPNLVSPEAAKAYNKITSTPSSGGQISVQAPNGKTYYFKDQDSANKFKAAAGIK